MAVGGTTARDQEAWICFADEAGQSLTPPKTRTWSRRGCTPIVTVSGKGSGRVNLAGLICLKPGHRARFIYRMRIYRRRKNARKGFNEGDYARLRDAVHKPLGEPIVLIWDNVKDSFVVCAQDRLMGPEDSFRWGRRTRSKPAVDE
ncbi:transposase [Nonomuraea sp. SBT364]|uniref:transposase n=1 Tax=Nonomuraea sp. SBT364 TaxID=1580530 RepID=UPI0012E26BFF|nr:transposase [Nonomuraea sp. SBT364]